MGATIPAPPIVRKIRPASFSATSIVSEAMPAFVAPQQELMPVSAMASEPIQPKPSPVPIQRRVRAVREAPMRLRGNRYRMDEHTV
jgi:hypothetical protein